MQLYDFKVMVNGKERTVTAENEAEAKQIVADYLATLPPTQTSAPTSSYGEQPAQALGSDILPTSLQDAVSEIPSNLGAVGRGLAQVTAPVTMIADPITHLLNLILPPEFKQKPPSEGLQALLTMAGVPEAQSEAQKIMQATIGGAAAGGGMVGLGKSLSGTGAQAIGEALTTAPQAQIAGGAAGAGASQTAGALGADPLTQTAVGLTAGVIGGAAAAPESFRFYQAKPKAPAEPAATPAPEPAPVSGASSPQDFDTASVDKLAEAIKKSAREGGKATKERAKLAEMAKINPEAKAAADSLGIDLPPDVFSDNPQVRAAAGLTRSVAGSEAEGAWRTTVRDAADKADELMAKFDAPYIEGRPAPAIVSSQTKNQIVEARKTIYDEAAKLSDEVSAAVPNATPASTSNLKAYLDQVARDVGGVENLSSYEKKLLKMVNSPATTYGLLNRERAVVGENLGKMKDQQFGDTDSAAMKSIYAAMAEDRKETVGLMGDEAVLEKLNASNLLFGKAFNLQDKIVDAFGKSGGGDISTDLPAAILSVSKGKMEDLNRILDIVPEDLHKQAVATALASVVRATSGSEKGGFGFSQFAGLYPKLASNPEAYKKIVTALGPGSHEVLQSLYSVSKRITDARANVLTTGKANQALVQAMTAETLVDKVLGLVSKPLASKVPIVGEGVAEALTRGSRDKLQKAGKMFNSEAFKNLATEAATKTQASQSAVNGVVSSAEFKAFADAAGLPKSPADRAKWIIGALAGSTATSASAEQSKPTSTSDRVRAAQSAGGTQ
jgi:hypothetical protein